VSQGLVPLMVLPFIHQVNQPKIKLKKNASANWPKE